MKSGIMPNPFCSFLSLCDVCVNCKMSVSKTSSLLCCLHVRSAKAFHTTVGDYIPDYNELSNVIVHFSCGLLLLDSGVCKL